MERLMRSNSTLGIFLLEHFEERNGHKIGDGDWCRVMADLNRILKRGSE